MSFNDPLVNEVLEPSAASSSNAPVTRPPSLLTLVREKVASLSDDYKHKFTTGGKLSHTVSLQRIETFAGSMLGNPKAVHEANVSWVGRNVDFLVGAVGLAKIKGKCRRMARASLVLCYADKASMERALVSMKHADCFIVPGYGDVQMTSVIGCPILGQGKSSKARRKLLGLSEPEKRRMERTLMECAVSSMRSKIVISKITC